MKRLSVGFVVRAKQGDLLKAIRERKWSQSRTADFLGMSRNAFGNLINLKWVPQQFSEKLTVGLFKLTGKLPEDLFPPVARTPAFLETSKTQDFFFDVTPEFLIEKRLLELPPSPDEVYATKERASVVEEMLRTLTPQQEQVIRGRFFDDKTLEEVGFDLGVGGERARAIEAQALSKLRKPSRSKKLSQVC